MRTFTRRPAVLAASAFAALGLTLTACGDNGSGTGDAGAGASALVAETQAPGAPDKAPDKKAPAAHAGSTSGATGGTGTAGETGTSGTAGGATAGGTTQAGAMSKAKSGGKAPACAYNDVKFSAAKQDGPPYTHITLTAKNTSGHSCTMEKYPLLAFGEIQTGKNVPAVAKSRPTAPVVLEPGAPAYAAVRVNSGGREENNRAVDTFYVNLFTGGAQTEGSEEVTVKGSIGVNDKVAKTGYWTHELRNGADEF